VPVPSVPPVVPVLQSCLRSCLQSCRYRQGASSCTQCSSHASGRAPVVPPSVVLQAAQCLQSCLRSLPGPVPPVVPPARLRSASSRAGQWWLQLPVLQLYQCSSCASSCTSAPVMPPVVCLQLYQCLQSRLHLQWRLRLWHQCLRSCPLQAQCSSRAGEQGSEPVPPPPLVPPLVAKQTAKGRMAKLRKSTSPNKWVTIFHNCGSSQVYKFLQVLNIQIKT